MAWRTSPCPYQFFEKKNVLVIYLEMEKKYNYNHFSFLLMGIFVVIHIFLHLKASFSFPIPWADEAAFYFPALCFMESNSLLSPHLNEARPLFWMPPAYSVFLGSLFKIIPPSLEF